MHFQRWSGRCKRRAYLEHVRSENLGDAGEIVGVVLHEGGATGQAMRHHLHGADQSGGLPVAFTPESIAVCHQPLNGDSGKLIQSVQILKSISESGESTLLKEGAEPELYLRCSPNGIRTIVLFAEGVGLAILGNQPIDLGAGDLACTRDEVSYTKTVHGVAELCFSRNLVAVCDGDLAHVVAKAGDSQILGLVPSGSGARPDGNFRNRFRVLPE